MFEKLRRSNKNPDLRSDSIYSILKDSSKHLDENIFHLLNDKSDFELVSQVAPLFLNQNNDDSLSATWIGKQT